VILGDQIEINLIRSIMSDPDPWLFVTRPISGTLLAAAVGSVVLALWQHHRAEAKRRLRESDTPEDAVDF
jgi:putative tricarboxylic transport membrane protein